MERVRELVNNTLTEKSREDFWDKFLDCKSDLRGVTPLEEWDLKYEQEFSSHRLEVLNAFINRRLEVLRNISSNKASGKYSSNPQAGSRVTDALEKFSCPLCQTPHRDGTYSSRPWLAACVKFLEMSIRDRHQTFQRLKYCKLCTREKEKYHKGQPTCPLADKFACKYCQGDKALSHCSLLCYSQEDPKSRLGRGQFGGKPPHDGDQAGCRGGGR